MKDTEIVMPGDKLATEEEFLPERGIFNENGYLFSLLVGDLFLGRGKIGVKPLLRDIRTFKEENVVICMITDLLPSIAFTSVSSIRLNGKDYVALKEGKIINPSERGHYGSSKKLNFSDYNVGDVLLAKIKYNDDDSYMLDIESSPELGVLFSVCEDCGEPMIYDSKLHMLACSKCKHVNNKDVSTVYGSIEEALKVIEKNL
ncbi:exosome complex RNA-binding protein Csl4 [Candidatus Mancarchaeum acidiphilum]|uniref:exosome complex RNA-binding protein Csl4 n=1 Tax=Candidatus Mancarchaeum acidiphilum TaxID=1920749 RepID=UPI000B587E10|nr:exosome complex RNA-binding protein Csl4 [Candidatus Mancarchaeum acidiphilum]